MNDILGARLMKRTTVLLIVLMALFSFVPRLEAGLAPSSLMQTQTMSRHDDMATVQKVLENKMVGQRLAALGYSPEEIDAKLGKLSDSEMHALASQIDSLAPGGEIGLIIGVLLIVLLVVVILRLVR